MDRIVEIQLSGCESCWSIARSRCRWIGRVEALDCGQGLGSGLWRAPAEAGHPDANVQDPLAEKILLGEILDGSTVKVTSGSDRLNFRSKPTVVATEAAA